jgi:hypothetical protein
VTEISEQGTVAATPGAASRTSLARRKPSARRQVADSLHTGWKVMSDSELAAVHAWFKTKAEQETGSWPITTAVVGSAAIAAAYMYDHGITRHESWSGVTTFGIGLLAVVCAALTLYRLLAIWRYERLYAEATYWLRLGPARSRPGDGTAEEGRLY